MFFCSNCTPHKAKRREDPSRPALTPLPRRSGRIETKREGLFLGRAPVFLRLLLIARIPCTNHHRCQRDPSTTMTRGTRRMPCKRLSFHQVVPPPPLPPLLILLYRHGMPPHPSYGSGPTPRGHSFVHASVSATSSRARCGIGISRKKR